MPWTCMLCGKNVAPVAWFCNVKKGMITCPHVECDECHDAKTKKKRAAEEVEAAWSAEETPVSDLGWKGGDPGLKNSVPTDPLRLFLMFVPMWLIEMIATNTNVCAVNERHKRKVQFYISIKFGFIFLTISTYKSSYPPHHLRIMYETMFDDMIK